MNPLLIQNAVKTAVAASVAAVAKKFGPQIIKTIGEVMKRKKS